MARRDRQKARDRKRRARQGAGGDGVRPEGDDANGHGADGGGLDEAALPEPIEETEADPFPAAESAEADELKAALARVDAGQTEATDAELEEAAEEAIEEIAPTRRPRREPQGGGGPRVVQFVRASWAELQRVQWPDRTQVFQATAVVLGFVLIAGSYLGLADYVAGKVVDFIL